MKRAVSGLILLLLVVALFFNRVKIRDFYIQEIKESVPVAINHQDVLEIVDLQSRDELPVEYNLSVPFMVQAPNANWDLPYQEACEEAAVIMLHYYWQNKNLTAELADQEINNLVAWQSENKDDYKDTTIEETAKIVEEYWDYQTEIINNPSPEFIKEKISQGYPIVAPFAGREIGNPFYSGEGPLYHMMVIKGYIEDKFITNDPGTRRGADYVYDAEHLLGAIHDWNDGQVETGVARILIIKP